MKVFCDGCGHNFRINRLRKRNLPRGIRRTFFVCPACKAEYTVSYTDRPIRKIHEQLKAVREAIKRARHNENEVEYRRLLRLEKDLRAESAAAMAELKERMEGG